MRNTVIPLMGKLRLRMIKDLMWSIFRFVLIVGLAFIIIQPLLIKLSSSFKSMSDLYDDSVFLIPKNPTLYNYIRVWDYLQYPVRFVNSVLYTMLCSILQVASCTLVAYGIARYKYRGRRLIFAMAIFTLVVPPQTILLPLFLQFQYFSPLSIFTLGLSLKGTNLIGTPIPLIILSAMALGYKNGLYIFMLRQYFRNLPKELEEVAKLDGCGPFGAFARVVLPGATTMLAAIFLFSFVWQWNDFFYTTILTPRMNIFTTVISSVGSAIAEGDGELVGNMHIMLYDSAALIVFIIPLIILYVFTQKLFVQSIERSGIVG